MSRLLRVPFVVQLDQRDAVPTECIECGGGRLAWQPRATWTAPPLVLAVLACVDCSTDLLVRNLTGLAPTGEGAADGRLEVTAVVEPGGDYARVKVGLVEVILHESLAEPGTVNLEIDHDSDESRVTVHVNDGLVFDTETHDPLAELVRVTEELGLYDEDPPPPCPHGRAQPCRECARTTTGEVPR